MPALLILIPLITLFYYFIFFLFVYDRFDLLYFGLIPLLFLVLSVAPLFIFKGNSHRTIISINPFNIEKFFLYSLFCSTIVIILLGVPLFSEDVNVSKMQIANYPILVRFFRIGIPYSLIYLSLLANNSLYPKKRLKKIYFVSFLISPLFGFKGYIGFVFFPFLFYLSLGKKRLIRFFIPILILLLVSLITISFIEGIPLTDAINYLIARLTEVNLLGNILALENPNEIEGIYPVYSEIIALLERIGGSKEINLMQSKLFEFYMNGNPYNMHVSVSAIIEFYSSMGTFGIGLFGIIYAITMAILYNLINYSRNLTFKSMALVFLIVFYDGILNGLLVFKFLDLIGSTIIMFLSFKLISSLFIKNKASQTLDTV
jgi:hypothetical protein